MKDVYNMISVPFVGVDGGNVPLSALQFSNVVKGEGPQECDFLQIWNGNGGYNNFYCYAPEDVWYLDDDATLFTEVYPNGIPAGTAAWYLAWVSPDRDGAPSFTVSGAIASEADITFTLNSTSDTMKDVYNMLSNPYPSAWLPGDPDTCVIENVVKGEGPQECDFLQVWNGDGGYNNFYCYEPENVWYLDDDATLLTEVYPNGIPAGTAAWYLAWVSDARSGDLKITFKNPVK